MLSEQAKKGIKIWGRYFVAAPLITYAVIVLSLQLGPMADGIGGVFLAKAFFWIAGPYCLFGLMVLIWLGAVWPAIRCKGGQREYQ